MRAVVFEQYQTFPSLTEVPLPSRVLPETPGPAWF